MTEFYSAFCVDCDLTMKPDTIIEKVAITTTFLSCPKCKSRIGIVTLNPLNASQTGVEESAVDELKRYRSEYAEQGNEDVKEPIKEDQ